MPESHSNRPGSPSRKRGAPPGNTNALKHGYYAKIFRPTEQDDLSAYDPDSLDSEITLLRVFIRRTAAMADKVDNLPDSMTLLNVLSRAALSLGSLARTRHLAAAARDHAEFQQLIHEAKAEFRRAQSLADRLAEQLAQSETAYDAVQSALELLFPAGEPADATPSPTSTEPATAPLLAGQTTPAENIPSLALPTVVDDPTPAIDLPAQPATELDPQSPPTAESSPRDDPSPADDPEPDLFPDLKDLLPRSIQTGAADPGAVTPEPDADDAAETDDDEDEIEYCKIPFDCFTCPERVTCDSCPPRIRAAVQPRAPAGVT